MIETLERKLTAVPSPEDEKNEARQEESLDPRVLSSVLVSVKLAQIQQEEGAPADPHSRLLELMHSRPVRALLDAACLYALYSVLTRSLDPFHVVLIVPTVVLLVLPVVLAEAGVDMVWCLAVLALAPWVTVVGYERLGHRHDAEVLAGLEDEGSGS